MPLGPLLPNGLPSFTNIGGAIGTAIESGGAAAKKTARDVGKGAADAIETGINMGVDAVNEDIDRHTKIGAGIVRTGGKAIDFGINTGVGVVKGNIPGVPKPPGSPFVPTFPLPGTFPPITTFPPIQPPVFHIHRTATQLADRSISYLTNAPTERVREGVNTINALIQNKRLSSPAKMITYLERKVRVGEVLQAPSSSWSAETHQDFADAFRMDAKKKDVMDAIVAIAILNDEDLDDEIRAENIDEASPDELMQNRRIVWQHPPPGTPLEPPYTVLVAVEHRDLAEAERVVDRIIGSLTRRNNFRLPSSIAGQVA